MRTLLARYLNHAISRRGFIKNMLAAGFTTASASSVLKSLENFRGDSALSEAEYRTVTGDGSVMYSASGFWTQARYGIPILTVVWNNQNYQTVRRSFASAEKQRK